MATADRLQSEQAFHDRQADGRAAVLRSRPDGLAFDDASYLRHETWVAPAFRQLGEVHGLRVLDYGCGHGMASVVLARQGARVTGLDLSAGYLVEAAARGAANGVAINFIRADAQRLPLADGLFDRVWGNAILHHLHVPTAARELFRVVRPGGRAVLCEPWGGNPLLRWARRRLPYQGKERTPDEEPLRRQHVALLRQVFPRVDLRGFQLLSMARRVLPDGRLVAALHRCDGVLLTGLPALQRLCRYMVLTLYR